MPREQEAIEISELGDMPRLRLATSDPGAGRRGDLEIHNLGGPQPLDLAPPALALDESGERRELPGRMPPQAGVPPFAATVAGGVVAALASTGRAYLLTARGELVVDSVDDSPNVWRRAEADWRSLADLGMAAADDPRAVILLGGQRDGYWHWWIDILPRVWLLERAGLAPGTGAPLVLAPPRFEYQRESLDLLGLTPRLRTLRPGLTRFATVTFTRGLTGGGSRFPSPDLAPYAGWLRERLLRAGGAGRNQGLFVSRGSAASRRVTNEAELEPVLAEHGFSVVDCAGMSVAEQAALFSRARAIVGPHGAGLTNLLFAKPRTPVVEIFAAPAAQGISNYRVLASQLGLPYCRLSAQAVPAKRHRGPHYDDMQVDPRLLGQVLDAVASL